MKKTILVDIEDPEIEAHFWKVYVWCLLEKRERARSGFLAALSFAALGAVLVVLLSACTAPPKPESVTLLRVDGGFMSCTTFLRAEDGGK